MPTFGIIAEGISDQRVIQNILKGCFGPDIDDSDVRFVQPPLDESGAAYAPGGWTLVFAALRQGKHEEALQFNDYVIVHIDTDRAEDKGYDVPYREGERELGAEELIQRVRQRLLREVDGAFFAKYQDRLIFAVAVHATECWLLPLLFGNQDAKASKTTGCLDAVNRERIRKNLKPLSDGDNKQLRIYEEASREYKKPRILTACKDKNPSLKVFVDALNALHSCSG